MVYIRMYILVFGKYGRYRITRSYGYISLLCITKYIGRRVSAMDKLKIVELVILAGSAIFAAAKSMFKFVDCIIKFRRKEAAASAA